MIERSLVLLKPDAIKRGLSGRIIQRFEDVGFKVVGAKMVWVDENLARQHYFDLGERRGEKVLQVMLKFITSGPVLALCLEGINAVENIRKMVGATEPRGAQPGTIRGDFAHISFADADQQDKAIENLIHASGNVQEAQKEITLWFKPQELHSYKSVHEAHTF
ncbi:nucleoside-diphosphate kinase [Candidatus Woesearchaeota archaeon]|nr:nucleoside-diphosphate kinase [Candidatus Woesearchaeota archaeon]